MTIHPAFYETNTINFSGRTLNTMKKTFKTMLYATAVIGALYSGIAQASAIALKSEATIQDEYLRLGHIFSGLDNHEDYILAQAPAPGKKLILNAYSLNQIAASFGLNWKTANAFEHFEVKRDATLIDAKLIEDVVAEHVKESLNLENIEVELSNSRLEYVIDKKFGKRLDVADLNFDSTRGFFDAKIKLANGDEEQVAGRIIQMVEVPVLATRLRQGDIISNSMIKWVNVPSNAISSNTILDAKDIVGMTPRRFVRENDLITDTDIAAPLIVEKGDFVTMILSNGRLQLTAKGRALDNGSKGETIRIVNKSSNKIVEGTVTAPQTVSVETGNPSAIF
ncbi:MAG: flagella basal body P-ring formation protein FlgA [Rickettsiales bacterium]|nr:flagella basal body P-ring formation protein FlgA [Rickettsiales bacterium]